MGGGFQTLREGRLGEGRGRVLAGFKRQAGTQTWFNPSVSHAPQTKALGERTRTQLWVYRANPTVPAPLRHRPEHFCPERPGQATAHTLAAACEGGTLGKGQAVPQPQLTQAVS